MMKQSIQAAASGGRQSAQNQSQQQLSQQVSSAIGGGLEKAIHFKSAQAIVWQIKFILNQITNKKSQPSITQEIENLRGHFGKVFEKYLIRELIEHIDLKDPNRAQNDKTEPFKVQILNEELAKASLSHTFLQYFGEISQHVLGDKVGEFLGELTKRLKLSFKLQLLVALSIHESCREEVQSEAMKLLKQKLVEYHNSGRPEVLPEYASHRLIYLLTTSPDLSQDETLREKDMLQYLRDTSPFKPGSNLALRQALSPGLFSSNASTEEPSLSLQRDGVGLDNLDKSYKMLEPWQVLIEIGHYCTYNYSYLLKVLEDFKDMNELKMARTLVHLAHNHTGTEDQHSRIVYNTLEACKKGDSSSLNQEPNDKVTTISWSVDNLGRAFRELYSNLNWLKVFEALSEIKDQPQGLLTNFDYKSFQVFLVLFNKCKPQNIGFPLQVLLQGTWQSTYLQLCFIEHSIQFYTTEKKDKSINFQRLERKQELVEDLSGIKDKVPQEHIQVWLSIELVEKLIHLSSSHHFAKVRQIFDYPIKNLPEYLLLTLSQCKPKTGGMMIDELLSLLLPQFLGNHINSIPVLQHLWKNNQALIIRGICELCRHDQRIMNLSRVLDITQEVRESLLPIVNCDDYYFAVNLGILAGKRDFLHYDQWLVERIKSVGTPFIKALLKYLKEHIIAPIQEFVSQRSPTNSIADIKQEVLENHKNSILDRSHLNREKLCITIEAITNLQLRTNQKVLDHTITQINEFVHKISEYYPNQFVHQPNTEEIDNAANEYFQRVFQAESSEAEQKIKELIETMLKFKQSEVKKEQEIYACMLHSLFDEYRFLHRYPLQYLEKIAKLYGAIIKNKIIDGTLQDIALKFALEAFRREGKRQKFGVIAIRQFLDMLPQYRTFFDEIYECRQSIATLDPAMLRDIEELYEKMIKEEEAARNNPTQTVSPTPVTATVSQAQPQKASQQNTSQRNPSASQQRQNYPENANTTSSSNQSNQNSDRGHHESQSSGKRGGKNQQSKDNGTEFVFQPANQDKRQTSNPKDDQKPSDQKKKGGQNEKQQNAKDSARQDPSNQRNTSQGQSQDNKNSGKGGIQNNVQDKRQAAVLEESKAPENVIQESTLQPSKASIFVPASKQLKQAAIQPSDTNFNIMSEEFKVNKPTLNQTESAPVALSRNFKEFRPARSPPPPLNQINNNPIQSQLNLLLIDQQIAIDKIIQKAITDGVKLRLEDLVEDKSLEQPEQDLQSKLIVICNNIGRMNFSQKLEEIKTLTSKDQTLNLKWLTHYILIRRITSNLQSLFLMIIKQLPRDALMFAINQSLEIFFRCLMIDEDKLSRAIQGVPGTASVIKKYLTSLGEFLGGLTVASNRPLYAKELDVKKLLVEAFFAEKDKLRLVVTFICRMMKECMKSPIFNKPQNPWIKANLEVLREIHEHHYQSNEDFVKEIESLFIQMNISNIGEIKHQGFLKHIISNRHAFILQNQLAEYNHLMHKQALIPPSIQLAYSYLNQLQPPPVVAQPTQPAQQVPAQQNQVEILSQVVVPDSFASQYKWLGENTHAILSSIVAKAVDSSILEILPPVVDRSVTIALITTRELVLKDFAYDSDSTKILSASNFIIQNLAGSLALVTCREPLKMSLTNNLKKAIIQLIKETSPERLETSQQENEIGELSSLISKENLELGCKIINKKVVEKAIARVQQDNQIMKAIEDRQRAVQKGFGGPFLINEEMAQQFSDLPPQLKPNPNGLTEQQFKVYEDFQKLNRLAAPSHQLSATSSSSSQRQFDIDQKQPQSMHRENSSSSNKGHPSHLTEFEQLLLILDRQVSSLNEPIKYQLSEKLAQLTSVVLGGAIDQETSEEIGKLWLFTQKQLLTFCEQFLQTGGDIEQLQGQIEILSLIVRGFKGDDLPKKLTLTFLKSNEVFPNELNLTLLLMKNGIISTSEWDLHISMHLRDNQQFQSETFLTFISAFIQKAAAQERVIDHTQFPNTIAIVEKLSQQPAYEKILAPAIEAKRNKMVWSKEKLKGYILQWPQISFEENNEKQEQEVNKFFASLQEIGFYKDSEIMYNFCKVMVEISIERALFQQNGTRRPSDRLDYRYIESFLKLMVVLLKTSETINKHEFMSMLFEAIQEVLDQDHKNKKYTFNQKPYYRLLINILIAVNNLQIINPKTHQLILFSLADLFSKINPNKYPEFAFAWLELISHKQFMPHFLAIQSNLQLQQFMSNNFQNKAAAGETSNTFCQKWFKYKELIVNLFQFLKSNMIQGLEMTDSLVKYYEATLRIVLVIKHDFPEFLCDFYFHFVNSLPENCVQLRNIILSANPKSVPYLNPFSKNLKVDSIPQIYHKPGMFSMSYDANSQGGQPGLGFNENQDAAAMNDHQVYLGIMNLREDLESYFRTRNPNLIQVICEKLMQSEENINGRRRHNSHIINAVVLFIGNLSSSKMQPDFKEKECYDMYRRIILGLNQSPETRTCFLNCLVNELRYINSQTYFYSFILIHMFSEINESIQEQITRILIERLQVHEPYPWGLCITFRELLQNPKYQFHKKPFVVQNIQTFDQLFQTRLQPLCSLWMSKRGSEANKQQQPLQPQEQQQPQQ